MASFSCWWHVCMPYTAACAGRQNASAPVARHSAPGSCVLELPFSVGLVRVSAHGT